MKSKNLFQVLDSLSKKSISPDTLACVGGA